MTSFGGDLPAAAVRTDNSNNQFAMISTPDNSNSINSSVSIPDTVSPRDHSQRHTCKICKYVLSSKRGLDVHSKCHNDERTFLCDLGGCRKRFRDASTLKQHQATHVEDRPFQCGFPGCERRFSRRDRKTIHQRSHTGEKPYKCKECGKAFACKVYLNVHRKYHSGSRQHCCDSCEKAFVHKGDLNKHKKIVHGRKSKGTRKTRRTSVAWVEPKRQLDPANAVTRLTSAEVGQKRVLIPPSVGEYLLPPREYSSAVMQSTPQTVPRHLSLPPPVVNQPVLSYGQSFSNFSSFAPRQSFMPVLKSNNFMAQPVSSTMIQPAFVAQPQPVGQAMTIQTPNVIAIPADVSLSSLFGNAPVSLVLNVTPTQSFSIPPNGNFRMFPF